MKILVTGAKGMLGQDLCPILEDEGYSVIETDIENLDVTDKLAVDVAIATNKPNIVIHTAAYTNVDKAESEQDLAMKINYQGTLNVAQACKKNNVLMIYISTDYVFDGEKKTPYMPNDEPNPINVYGLTKLKGEQAVKENCAKYYIVRTSWLYGHHGNNFVETMLSKAQDEEINVVSDQVGCPTWTIELVNGLLEIIEEEKPFGIYHVCGSGEASWYDFAKEIFARTDMYVNVQDCKTSDFPRPAKRPKYSVMDNQKICRGWKTALKDYMMLRFD